MVEKIRENYKEILEDIKKIKGKENKVRVVCASKYTDGEGLLDIINAGIEYIGENRVQAMKEKREYLENKGLENKITWDFIGNLQKNKIKYIIDYVDLIQSVHEYSLLEELDKKAIQKNRKLNVLLEVNISGEESKHGFEPSEIIELGEKLINFTNVKIIGLMTMAPNTSEEDIIRKTFRGLREFKDELNKKIFNGSLTELSIGMSNDYKIALEEGATIIRIGSRLFN